MGDFLKKAFVFLGSFELAFVLLILLGLLTFVGTLDQQHMSLYDVQAKYFESIILVYEVGGVVPVPLLGGYLLLTIFFVNIIVGGLIRIRKGKSTVGILIAHVGIVALLFGSFIEFQHKTEGQLTLWAPETYRDVNGNGQWDPGERFTDSNRNGRFDDGESGSHYKAVHAWEVAVTELKPTGAAREYLIPEEHFKHLGPGDSTRYQHADLPFDVVLSGYAVNSQPRPVKASEARDGIGLDGFVLAAMDPVGAGNRRNLPGIVATLQPKKGQKAQAGILWGGSIANDGQRIPWPVKIGDRRFQVDLRNKIWDLPFTIRMNRFVHKRYPGMSMAKEFSSYVTKVQGTHATDIHITMNEPLRHEGYTLYQSGWGPESAPPGGRLYSTFSVVANPTDQVPLWSCVVIALGLLIHFVRKLVLHLKAEARRRAPKPQGEMA